MSDFVYCYSDPDKPGLVKLAVHRSSHNHAAYSLDNKAGRGWVNKEWSLKVADPEMTLKAIKRSLRRLRKDRGSHVYRCSAHEIRSLAIKYTTLRSKAWRYSSSEVRDNVLASMLIVAFALSVLFSQLMHLGTKSTLGLTATILTSLTIALAYHRRSNSFEKSSR